MRRAPFIRVVGGDLMSATTSMASSAPPPKAKKSLWTNLGFQIVVAMVLGAAVGFLFPSFATQLKILGDIFLRLIKTAVAPLVFLCVAVGIVSAGDFKRVGKVGLVAMLYFEIVSTTSSHFGFLGCGGVGWLGWGRLRRCSAGRARWRPSEGQGFQELGPGGEHNIGAQGLQVVEEAGSGSKRLAGVPPSA